jgi:hypothetical protein
MNFQKNDKVVRDKKTLDKQVRAFVKDLQKMLRKNDIDCVLSSSVVMYESEYMAAIKFRYTEMFQSFPLAALEVNRILEHPEDSKREFMAQASKYFRDVTEKHAKRQPQEVVL